MDTDKIREPIVDGLFYPDDPQELRDQIRRFLDTEMPAPVNRVRGCVTPHAAYEFCGSIIGAAAVSTSGRFVDTVVLIGPVHRERENAVFLSESDGFRTPLGIIPVDRDLTEEIESCSNKIFINDIPHLEEHCLEVQLPFLQVLHPEASIVPILMGAPTASNIKALAGALDICLSGKKVLCIATSNLSSASAKRDSDEQAKMGKKLIMAGDPAKLTGREQLKGVSLCGPGGIACLFSLRAPGIRQTGVRLLSEASSSGMEADGEFIVHYAAFALEGEE